jgi:acetyl esterase/lipase
VTVEPDGLDREEYDRLLEEARQLATLATSMAAMAPDLSTREGIERMRVGQEKLFAPMAVDAEVIDIPGPAGPMPARVIRPEDPEGIYLDLHGGGWCFGAAKQQDFLLVELAHDANVITVSVDYRLAPEHPFPAAVDDAEAATRWLIDDAPAQFGLDRVALGGWSAGAHLATLALLRVRDGRGADATKPIASANLMFGGYDLGMTPSARMSEEAPVLSRETLEAFVSHFLPGRDAEARRDPDCSPLYASLYGLPPARFTVGTADPLLDDNLFMAARWRAAGNQAELAVYDESIHGFAGFPLGFGPMARSAASMFVQRTIREQFPSATPGGNEATGL